MFVPVTTKPFLNSVNFSALQRVSLHYFSLIIKEKTKQHFTSCENGNHWRHVNSSGTRLYRIIRLTLQTYSGLQVIHFVRF
jgi:hypothetical protein